MEKSQNLVFRNQDTPKRGKPSDDELSPEYSQLHKVQKKMEIQPEVLDEILAGIRKINSIELTLANVMQQMVKLQDLEPLQKDISEIAISYFHCTCVEFIIMDVELEGGENLFYCGEQFLVVIF